MIRYGANALATTHWQCGAHAAISPIGVFGEERYLFDMQPEQPNPLIRLFLNGTAVGFALSALFVTGIWLLDIAGIHTRAAQSDDAFLILFILWFFHGLLFGAVQISYVVWQIGRDGQ
ncbi:hypothetical protein [Tateyamaria omphalii]|uniref:hypothetical protein n=1 Tax=Tateyamaria omphalii TaxID=299262 RepID=UPI001672C9B1|nr:hypothetical protein [Tateyamaria omphalii]